MTNVDATVVDALGWALVHFLWQGALVAAMLAVLDLAARGASARLRYALAATALAVMATLPAVTFTVVRARHAAPPRPPAAIAGDTAVVRASAGDAGRLAASDAAAPGLRARIAPALPEVVGLWLAGVAVLSIRYLGGWRLVRRMSRSGRPLGDANLAARLDRLRRRMRVSRPVLLLESALVEVPAVVGWLRPAILVPAATLAGLSPEQLEAVLAHELAHVRRLDYLAGLLQGAVETLLFYHPAVWWVSHRMRVEREMCCDDEAVAACGDPVGYARALADLETLRPAPPRLALAVTGGSLFDRVSRLVMAPAPPASRGPRGLAGLVALATLALAGSGLSLRASTAMSEAQDQARPAKRSSPATPASASPKRARVGTAARPTAIAPEVAAGGAASPRHVPMERLIELASAGVTPDYVDGMIAAGYPSLSWEQLIALRSQGVGPDYVRGLAAEKLAHLSLSDLLQLRSQGVSPEYVRALREAGFEGLSVTDLLGARSHGVSPEDAAALKAMGYTDLTVGRLVALRSQGVDADFVRAMQELGYRGLSVSMLIGLRSHGVGPEYARDLKDLGYSGLAAGELIELRSHGVDPEYVRALKDAGYDHLTTRELIDLRSHGVDPEVLKRLKARTQEERK
jgi:bla regulator protein blaR1